MRSRIRTQQIEREKEQTDHAVMLRELQKLLASERHSKEAIEQQHDDVQFNMKEKDHLLKELQSRHDQEVNGLRSQIKTLQDQLISAQIKSEEPSPVVVSLQKETEELKVQQHLFNPLFHMPIWGSSSSAANRNMMSKIWTNGVQLSD